MYRLCPILGMLLFFADCIQERSLLRSASLSYTSYFTGDQADVTTQPQGGVCLMSGGKENDEAMRWFLQRSGGGDVIVLRASGADGYNDYMYKTLGVKVNSVETIVFNDATASRDTYVLQQIANAEAIWFAGGDQWNYVKYWRHTAVDSIINVNIANKKVVVGGLSAGMAILGSLYFAAEKGSVQSEEALQNPLSDTNFIQNQPFLKIPYLQNIITDTHYANRNRQGRHVVFLAKALQELGVPAKGMACDEQSAICVDETGKAYVYGSYPAHNEYAYFIQVNCELPEVTPETYVVGKPLHWVRDSSVLKVYQIKAEPGGKNYFDLNNWKTGSGGEWKHWYVINGVLKTTDGTAIQCKK